MELFEKYTHSFVIKIWVEETAEEADNVVWRGRIVHVGDNEKGYFQDLDHISIFIWPYLNSMGVKARGMVRLRLWLNKFWVERVRSARRNRTAESEL
jgi:hypothetical protein